MENNPPLAYKQISTNSSITSHIIDNGNECSIVLNGTLVKYVTSYSVECNNPYMVELKLHLSMPKKWSVGGKTDNTHQQTKVVEKDGKCTITLNGTPIEYLVSYCSIGRGKSNMIELELHMSIPRKEIYLDIETI